MAESGRRAVAPAGVSTSTFVPERPVVGSRVPKLSWSGRPPPRNSALLAVTSTIGPDISPPKLEIEVSCLDGTQPGYPSRSIGVG